MPPSEKKTIARRILDNDLVDYPTEGKVGRPRLPLRALTVTVAIGVVAFIIAFYLGSKRPKPSSQVSKDPPFASTMKVSPTPQTGTLTSTTETVTVAPAASKQPGENHGNPTRDAAPKMAKTQPGIQTSGRTELIPNLHCHATSEQLRQALESAGSPEGCIQRGKFPEAFRKLPDNCYAFWHGTGTPSADCPIDWANRSSHSDEAAAK